MMVTFWTVICKSQKVHACFICGKVARILSHSETTQKCMKPRLVKKKEEKGTQTEHKCPYWGKSFIRPSLLLAHLKVHRPLPSELNCLPCEQSNKSFISPQTWMNHIGLHKQRPFWCFTCPKGFREEILLEKHLQGHNLKRHRCSICCKSFSTLAGLRNHYNTHTGAKPYKCTLCKRNFSQLGNMITHRKKHIGVYIRSSKTPFGTRRPVYAGRRRITEMKRLIFTGVDNKAEMEMCMEEVEGEEESGNWCGPEAARGFRARRHYLWKSLTVKSPCLKSFTQRS